MLVSTDPTLETCAGLCRLCGSHPATWARTYTSGIYISVTLIRVCNKTPYVQYRIDRTHLDFPLDKTEGIDAASVSLAEYFTAYGPRLSGDVTYSVPPPWYAWLSAGFVCRCVFLACVGIQLNVAGSSSTGRKLKTTQEEGLHHHPQLRRTRLLPIL